MLTAEAAEKGAGLHLRCTPVRSTRVPPSSFLPPGFGINILTPGFHQYPSLLAPSSRVRHHLPHTHHATPAESTSTRSSPHTPRTPVFGRNSESQPSVSINSEEQEGEEEEMLSVTSSSVSYTSTETDEYGVTSPNLKSSQTKESIITLSNGPFGRERARHAPHPYAGDHDDVFTEQRGPAATVEADAQSVATSESCYSLDTYHDPADENYRLSRTESQMNLPFGDSSSNHAQASASSAGLRSPPRFNVHGAASHNSAPPDIRVESASTISHIPTPTAATYGHISPPSDYDQLQPPTHSSPRYQRVRVPSFGMGRQTVDPRTIQNEAAAGGKAPEKEWTLFLGDKAEEDSFVRVRKASQSVGTMSLGRKAGKAVAAQASAAVKNNKEPI
ncbi:hypothetical protein NMY22_g11688 [Coprinellus aureogranulatus]|nr:hypothetical protein NMY22_g11688 [Coprinellus aureogranulatus]